MKNKAEKSLIEEKRNITVLLKKINILKKENMLFHKLQADILEKMLKKNILISLKNHNINIEDFHHNSLLGLIKILTKIIINDFQNPKYETISYYEKEGTFERFKGWYIYSDNLKTLSRNKICQRLSEKYNEENYLIKKDNTYLDNISFFVTRVEDSTYHANNGIHESNGYSHHYTFSEMLQNCYQVKNTYLKNVLERKYLNSNSKILKYTQKLQKSNLEFMKNNYFNDNTSYFKIPLQVFKYEFEMFNRYLNPYFSTIFYNTIHFDKDYVYINNRVNKNKDLLEIDGWEEKQLQGREYTVFGSLEKELRRRLFDFEEYDVSTCVQIIMLNLYYKSTVNQLHKHDFSTLKNDFPMLYEFIKDKVEVRKKISELFRIDIKKAKTLITHITNSPKTNILSVYGQHLTPLQKKRAKKYITVLVNELKKLKKEVLKKYFYYTDINSKIYIGNVKINDIKNLVTKDIENENMIKKRDNRGKCYDDRVFYRINIIVENQIRNKMIEFAKKQGCTTPIYQIHDCILSSSFPNVNVKNMSEYIKQELGLYIGFEKS